MNAEYTPQALTETEASDRAANRTIRGLRQQWWLVVLCAVVAGAAAYFLSSSRPSQYSSVATLQVKGGDALSNYLSDGLDWVNTDAEREVTAAVQLFSLPIVQNRASELLRGELPGWKIAEALQITSVPDSGVITVVATAGSPRLAKNIANASVQAFIARRTEMATDELRAAREQVSRRFNALPASDKNSENGRALKAKIERLDLLGTIGVQDVTVAQPALLSGNPVSPKPVRDAIAGLIGGAILGLLIGLIRARFDERIRDPEEFAELWNLPIVGRVPSRGSLKEQGVRLPEPEALESLALARTNLRYLQVGRSNKTVLITSAIASEGKSTVAWNLAMASALSSSRTLLIEADLRRPMLSSRLSLGGPGLSEVLVGLATPEEAIRRIDVPAPDGSIATSVDVLPAGMAPPSPIALFEDERTKSVFHQLREQYDVVYIDSCPTTVVADSVALLDSVDGVVVVARLGVVTRSSYTRMRDILVGAHAPVLAQITNGDGAVAGYGYYRDPVAASPRMNGAPAKHPAADADAALRSGVEHHRA